jgi:hypothetical protein
MKVYEKINQLKETNASIEQISSWAYMNRICPLNFGEGLELDCEYPKELQAIAEKCCSEYTCSDGCLDGFLNSLYKEAEGCNIEAM